MRQAWSRFCLINSLTGSCEGVKRELWLPVLIEGLQGTCACCPLLSASECKGLCQCELSYRSQVQSLLHIITLHIISHSPSHSPSSPMFTCPFCALTSKGGEDLLFFFFFLNMHRFPHMWLWDFSKYLLATCRDISFLRGKTENEFASSCVAPDLWKMSQASSEGHFCPSLCICQSTWSRRRLRDPGDLPVSGRGFVVTK